MTDPLLEVRKLSAGYGPIGVLSGVEMKVEGGTLTAVLGPNGAGKTTLFKAILGLVRVTEGSIVYKGQSVEHEDTVRLVRSGMSLVPEGRGLFPSMTVRENLLLGAFHHRRDRAGTQTEMEQVLELFPVLGERLRMLVS